MSKICWLQISDIHLGYRSYTTHMAQNKLYDYLYRVIAHKKVKPTMLFLTGDYIYAPQMTEDWDKSALSKVKEILTQTSITTENVYLVPGNHDIYKRDAPSRNDILDGVYKDYSSEIGIIDSSRIKVLLSSFDSYDKFYKSLYKTGHAIDPVRSNWSSDNIHVAFETDSLNIVQLNTSIFYGKNHDSGNMILGTYHIAQVMSEISNTKPIIVLGHHPLSSFQSEEERKIRDIFNSHSVALYLCGHGHVIQVNKGADRFCEVMSPTSMSREEKTKAPCQIGFLIGELDTDKLEGVIEAHFFDPFSNMWDKYRQIGGVRNSNLDDRINGIMRF